MGMWNFPKTFPSVIFPENHWQKSCDVITSTVFQIQKFEKNWRENVNVGMENDWSESFVLLCGWNNEDVRWDFFSIQIYWEVMNNFESCDKPKKLRLLITSQWIGIEKNPTVHLHYVIHRARQNYQTSDFPFQCERFLVSVFTFLNLKNCWCDDVTWLLSTIFMKDHRRECFGKISHPYRVWKVYKQRCSENT